MEYIDASGMESVILNDKIKGALKNSEEVTLQNPRSMHNIGIGLKEKGRLIIEGSTGFYTGGFMEEGSILVNGNTGWYAGDNMMGGELIITQNTGSNAGVYLTGGTMIIRGATGSRAGYGMKGGTIIVCGPCGKWAGQMILGGKLVLLGKAGTQIGESMYKGTIFVADEKARENLGGNVYLDDVTAEEEQELDLLFEQYQIKAKASLLKAVRPSLTGRHSYVIFKPVLEPEDTRKPQ